MTTPTIHELRQRLGLTTGALARLVGVDRRTVQRWLDGSQDVPAPVYRLLRVLAEQPKAMAWLTRHLDASGIG